MTEVTVALLVDAPLRSCPKVVCAAEFARNSFANPEGVALSPKTHGLSEDLAVVTSPEAAPSTQPELVGGETEVSPVEKQVSPRKREVHAA